MKDPAFLFYSSDFLTGTVTLTNEQTGKYIKLLCMQHQKGHLTEKDMLKICNTYDEDVYDKFVKDNDGKFYNKRLETEVNKRKAYSESRRNNRLGKNNTCMTYDKHMVNEDINIDINNIIDESMREETTDNELVTFYQNNIGSLSPFQYEILEAYEKDIGTDMVIKAMQIACEQGVKKLNYIEGILKTWKQNDIKTLIQVDQENEKKRQQGKEQTIKKNDPEWLNKEIPKNEMTPEEEQELKDLLKDFN